MDPIGNFFATKLREKTMTVNDLVQSNVRVTNYDNMNKYSFRPGNGHKYEILVVNIHEGLELGILGGVGANGNLIVNGFTGMSYLLSGPVEYISCDYVADKFFTRDFRDNCNSSLEYSHVHAVTALIAWVLNRYSDATIEGMRLDPPSIKEELDDYEIDMRKIAGVE